VGLQLLPPPRSLGFMIPDVLAGLPVDRCAHLLTQLTSRP